MKTCELCKFPARTFCESDQASLCWDCDAKVHGANFLVARHVRCLLCQTCQSLTPWRAAGTKLGRTVSLCQSCVSGDEGAESEAENEDDDVYTSDDESIEDDGDMDEEEEEEEDGDNQVVPWSSEENTPMPASSSSSSAESGCAKEVSETVNTFSLKRTRESSTDLRTQDLLSLMPSDVLDYSSSRRKYGSASASRRRLEGEEAVSADATRPLKDRRIEMDYPAVHISGSIPAAAVNLFRRLGSKNLNKESQSFDLNS
ncbi:hypothetical protein SLA2020_217710 [Shorea laevis]